MKPEPQYFFFTPKSDPSPSRAYCIFTELTNSNVLGKLPIHDSNNREIGIAIGGFDKNTIHGQDL